MANFTLTAGADTMVGGAADDTVYATAATLNAGDSLTGGAGTDVLALVGSGSFRIDQLASFTGFERIRLDNATNSSASLTLGSQPIEVDATGYLNIHVNSPSNWNGSNIINGDASHTWTTTSLSFHNFRVTLAAAGNLRSDLEYVLACEHHGGGDNVTLLINNANTAGVQSFNGCGAELPSWRPQDRRSTFPTRRWLGSRSPAPTAWARPSRSATWARRFRLPAARGRTPSSPGLHLHRGSAQRHLRHRLDRENHRQSGTYAAPPPSPDVVGLTTGNDTIVTPSSGSTVYATAATLNAGDSLTGGAGTDVLALVGSGSFRVDQLASFTGFERIRLDNATNYSASLTLGSQPIEVDATGYLSIQVNSPSNWNGSNIINGDASHTWPRRP